MLADFELKRHYVKIIKLCYKMKLLLETNSWSYRTYGTSFIKVNIKIFLQEF